jgi:hypothetical protein
MELLILLLLFADLKIREAVLAGDKKRWVVFHAYIVTCFLLDLERLNRKYVVIALLRQVKGESGDRAHLLPCVPTKSSGIGVKELVKRLMDLKRKAS